MTDATATPEATTTPEEAAKTLVITLTDRAPVEVKVVDWPVLAQASDIDTEYESEANTRWTVKARGHRDGRWIVYGIVVFTSLTREAPDRGGEIVDNAAAVPAAIRRVVATLDMPPLLADECIADMPPEPLV